MVMYGNSLRPGGGVVTAPDFGSRGPVFVFHWSRNSAYDCTTLHLTEPFIIILSSSRYYLNNVERDVKHQTIVSYNLAVEVGFNVDARSSVIDFSTKLRNAHCVQYLGPVVQN